MNTGASSFLRVKILVCALAAASAYGQGTSLQFCNDCLPSPPDRLVRDVNGNPLVGTNYVAQLYYGASPDSLLPTTGVPARFKIATTTFPGTWQRSTRNIPAPGPGPFYLQVKVWDTDVAPTYDQAAASPTGQYGRSEIFLYTPCPPPPQLPPHGCDLMLGFLGFSLMTNPPDRTLVIRENGDRVDLLYSGTHTIEGAASLGGPWVILTISAAPYTDPASGTNRQRFYRMRDEPGPTYSLNAVGYYRVDVCAGFSLIANQLNAHGGNTIANVLKSPLEWTEVYKFNPASGGYTSLAFLGGAWEGDDLEVTLNPGEGVFVNSPAAHSYRFLGEVPQIGSVAIRPGWNILSAPLPISGPVNQSPPNGIGFPVEDSDCFYQWNCALRAYVTNCRFLGVWEGDGNGATPIVGLGEAFFFMSSRARTWNTTHCLTCP